MGAHDHASAPPRFPAQPGSRAAARAEQLRRDVEVAAFVLHEILPASLRATGCEWQRCEHLSELADGRAGFDRRGRERLRLARREAETQAMLQTAVGTPLGGDGGWRAAGRVVLQGMRTAELACMRTTVPWDTPTGAHDQLWEYVRSVCRNNQAQLHDSVLRVTAILVAGGVDLDDARSAAEAAIGAAR